MKLLYGWIIKIWAESKRRYTTCLRFLTESMVTLKKKKRNLHFLALECKKLEVNTLSHNK